MAAKSASLEDVLTSLNRVELLAICDAHELTKTGDKPAILSRLLGRDSDAATPEPAADQAPKAKRKKKEAKVDDMTGKTGNGGVLGFESQLWANSELQPLGALDPGPSSPRSRPSSPPSPADGARSRKTTTSHRTCCSSPEEADEPCGAWAERGYSGGEYLLRRSARLRGEFDFVMANPPFTQ